MSDLDTLTLPPAPVESARSTVTPHPCRRHRWVQWTDHSTDFTPLGDVCSRCGKAQDPIRSKRGRQSRNYGNRAELHAARTYGGTKVGHAGGPVDIRGRDWSTQMKTHRRLPPVEWTNAFAAMAASTDRLPRLLLRFVRPGNQGPDDYFVVRARDWLEWHGKDE